MQCQLIIGDWVFEFRKKYILHIPLYKFVDDKLILLEIDDVMDILIDRLDVKSLYMTRVKSMYKKRTYDEILLTVFSNDNSPAEIFEKWFRENNNVLSQEAFAYETGNKLIVKKL